MSNHLPYGFDFRVTYRQYHVPDLKQCHAASLSNTAICGCLQRYQRENASKSNTDVLQKRTSSRTSDTTTLFWRFMAKTTPLGPALNRGLSI
jgi:hypothetical protein